MSGYLMSFMGHRRYLRRAATSITALLRMRHTVATVSESLRADTGVGRFGQTNQGHLAVVCTDDDAQLIRLGDSALPPGRGEARHPPGMPGPFSRVLGDHEISAQYASSTAAATMTAQAASDSTQARSAVISTAPLQR